MEPPASSPCRHSNGLVRECLVFPVLERNKQERLEALMRRSMERSLQLEQRPKRWTWGSAGGAREGELPESYRRVWGLGEGGEDGKSDGVWWGDRNAWGASCRISGQNIERLWGTGFGKGRLLLEKRTD